MFIAIQNDKPIPVGASDDEVKVTKGAEDWANYSKQRVSILRVTGPFVDLHRIILPE